MLTPVIPASFTLTSDGISTAVAVDLTTVLDIETRGKVPSGMQLLKVMGPDGAVALSSSSLTGWLLQMTFQAPLPVDDSQSVLAQYTVSFLLQMASLQQLS